jgi:hypothetical protein
MQAEKRKLTGDLYGLRGWFQGGRCVDHLPRGLEITLDTNPAGEPCIFVHGREYPLDFAQLDHARRRSEAC